MFKFIQLGQHGVEIRKMGKYLKLFKLLLKLERFNDSVFSISSPR